MRSASLGAIVLLGLSGCGVAGDAAVAQAGQCRVAQPLVPLPTEVQESSGAAMSRLQPTLVWTHNDSGGDAMLYAVDVAGRPVGEVRVQGAQNVDWEDIASGECSGGNCLYVADTGDNEAARTDIRIYRLPEPDPQASGSVAAEALPIRFPERPDDAEALFVLPGERIFLVTKGEHGPVALYRYPGPPRPGELVQLELVRRLSQGPVPLADRVTGASASPDGRRAVLRTRTAILLYDAEALVTNRPTTPINVHVGSLGEAQGEAVAVGRNGAIVLTSEAGGGGGSATLGILWCP